MTRAEPAVVHGKTMADTCEIVTVAPVLLALTQAELLRSEIPARIRGMFDITYSWLRSADVRQAGHNYALYDKCTKHSLRVRVGFPVSGPFHDTESIHCIEFSPGPAAHATHIGPYVNLHVTYRLLAEWCLQEHLPLSGESWEIYGDWNDDPSKLKTDLYLALKNDP
jgi:effector-binding domain-containing protein